MSDNACAYDLATLRFANDLVYWTGLVNELSPPRELGLGCGIARISFALAATGIANNPNFTLVGLDRSQRFLDRARARSTSSHPSAASATRFVEGDMADFRLHDQFELIVVAYNNLAYLITDHSREGCLRAIRSHLPKGGQLAIDLHVPNLGLLAEAQRETFPIWRRELEWVDPAPGSLDSSPSTRQPAMMPRHKRKRRPTTGRSITRTDVTRLWSSN
jgi:SAM-dependent methyltransferase